MERLTIFDGNKWDRATLKVKNQDLIDKLATYEDADEQGYLLWLPCKEGDTVWVIDNFGCDRTLKNPPQIREIKFNHYLLDFVGKTVFLTRAEAEKALKEMESA